MEKPIDTANRDQAPIIKKVYRRPELSIYGKIHEVTRTIQPGNGMNDTIHGVDKTGF